MPPSVKRVFVTSTTALANFGGLAAADSNCQAAATAGNLGGGGWRAWLSDSTTSAPSRLIDVGPWYLVDNVTIAFNTLDETTTGGPMTPITLDEHGAIVPTYACWTGTTDNGTPSTWTCNSWTSTSSIGRVGIASATNENWSSNDNLDCSLAHRFYCFEQ